MAKGKTQSDWQRDYDNRRKAEGWRRMALWVHPAVDREKIRKYVAAQNKKADRSAATQ
jgi:hypothetical protein